MKNLEELRSEIDAIDKQLVALFEERMKVVLDVAAYKKANNIPVLHSNREQEVIAKACSLLQNKEYSNALTRWLELTMALSREEQAKQLKE